MFCFECERDLTQTTAVELSNTKFCNAIATIFTSMGERVVNFNKNYLQILK